MLAILVVEDCRAETLFELEALDILRQHRIPTRSVGLYVKTIDGEIILDINGSKAHHPASTIKLLTTLAALELLGPDHTWRTEAYIDVPMRDGAVHGDLVLKGGGDPSLVTERFWTLLRGLRDRGLRHIDGDIVVDNSVFDTGYHSRDAFDGQPYRAYNVPPAGLLINYGVTRFVVYTVPQTDIVRVFADPPVENLVVHNELKAIGGRCRRPQIGLRVLNVNATTRVTLTGTYPIACGEYSLYRSVMSHEAYILGVFKSLWKNLGGTITGGIRLENKTRHDVPLLVHHSPTVAESIRSINKFSNNVMARQLLLTLGVHELGQPGSVNKGVIAINRWLAMNKLKFPELVIDNGAGLSRITRISSRHLVEVLRVGYRSAYQAEYLASLPIVGADGFLNTRLSKSEIKGRVRAKTGLLDHVRALAGYVSGQSGRRFIVVMLINHQDIHHAHGTRAQDALLGWLLSK